MELERQQHLGGCDQCTLLLTNVQVSQAGNYAVLVSNSAGSVISSNALLTVITNSGGCVSAPANLVGWWKGEGNALDSAGTNNGVAQGGLTYGTGEVGQGFVFNGTNAYVKIAANSNLNVGTGAGFTIEAWINPSKVSDQYPIVEWNSGSGYGLQLWIGTPVPYGGGPGCLYANLETTGGGDNRISSAGDLIVSNQYQHVAVTYDKASGVATLYLNGNVVAQRTPGSLTAQTTLDLYLGYRPAEGDVAHYWPGVLDEVSLYSRALTTNEVLAIYNAGGSGKCSSGATAPTITSQPVSQTVTAGSSVSFSVTASGTAPLSYQWSWNVSNTLAGATNATLLLTNVQVSQAGNYAVLVSNSAGSVISSNALLTVGTKPSIITQPVRALVIAGCSATFVVEARGTAPLLYQWSKDDTTLLGRTNATLAIASIQASDVGNYRVTVSNAYGFAVTLMLLLRSTTCPSWGRRLFTGLPLAA